MRERRATEEAPADVVFSRLAAGFRRALAREPDGCRTFRYLFSGRPVRVRVVGSGAAREVLGPFAHLLRTDGPRRPTDGGLRAPDGARSAAEGPRRTQPPRADQGPGLAVDLWEEPVPSAPGPSNPSISMCVSGGARWVARREGPVHTAMDREEPRLVGRISNIRCLNLYQRAFPLRSELMLWCRDRGILPIHAALVARDEVGVLLGGPGGAGKSSVLLRCLEAGFQAVGDDYVGIDLGAGFPRQERAWNGRGAPGRSLRSPAPVVGHSLYSSAPVAPGDLERFPALLPHVVPVPGRLPEETKALVALADAFPDCLTASVRIRVLVLPRVSGRARTEIRPATADETFRALMPTALRQLPPAHFRWGLERLGRLVRRVPARRLELGRDPLEIHHRIQDILLKVSDGRRS